jgi:hypothetical protein
VSLVFADGALYALLTADIAKVFSEEPSRLIFNNVQISANYQKIVPKNNGPLLFLLHWAPFYPSEGK